MNTTKIILSAVAALVLTSACDLNGDARAVYLRHCSTPDEIETRAAWELSCIQGAPDTGEELDPLWITTCARRAEGAVCPERLMVRFGLRPVTYLACDSVVDPSLQSACAKALR